MVARTLNGACLRIEYFHVEVTSLSNLKCLGYYIKKMQLSYTENAKPDLLEKNRLCMHWAIPFLECLSF